MDRYSDQFKEMRLAPSAGRRAKENVLSNMNRSVKPIKPKKSFYKINHLLKCNFKGKCQTGFLELQDYRRRRQNETFCENFVEIVMTVQQSIPWIGQNFAVNVARNESQLES